MKKIFAILCAASALLISCTKVAPEAQEIETGNAAGKLQVNIAVSREGDTKAVKTGWEKGDVIYVFFNNLAVSSTPKYLTLTFDGNGWDNTWYGDADADLLTMSTGTMSAIYFPFHSGKVSITVSGSLYILKDSATNGKIDSYVLRTISSPYNITSGNLTGTLEMKLIPEDLGYILTGGGSHPYAFFMPDQNSGSSYVLECAYLNHMELSYYYNSSYWQFDYKNTTGAAGYFQNDGVNKGYVFTLYHDETDNRNASGYVFRLTNGTNKYDFFKSVSGSMLPGAYALPSLDSGRWMKVGDNETVTICGKKWATVNLGATDPKEVGTHGTFSSISIPSGWRLPTRTEFEELIAGTEQYYVPYYYEDYSSLYKRYGGYIFVDKTNHDNFIFFPGDPDDGDRGNYWASDMHHYDGGTSTFYYNYFHFTDTVSPSAPTGGRIETSDFMVRLIKQ